MDHVTELHEGPLESILRGDKTIETRFFRNGSDPLVFDNIHVDDTLYLKLKGGYTVAKANVSKVEILHDLTPDRVTELLDEHKGEILPTERMYEGDIYSNKAMLVWMENLQEIKPFRLKDGLVTSNGWIMVDDINLFRD
jgi:hypothetical protein